MCENFLMVKIFKLKLSYFIFIVYVYRVNKYLYKEILLLLYIYIVKNKIKEYKKCFIIFIEKWFRS